MPAPSMPTNSVMLLTQAKSKQGMQMSLVPNE